ncbi:MAG: divalent-cation tolerance protein CutA [Candidatus Omnitrophica bacterium]|nr:divalent-cation tolerance protein CutA [Candidatus Omnitrophota bacterium]
MIVILVTAKDRRQAGKIAAALVGEKLAACVYIVPEGESFFFWEQQLRRSREVLLIIKTEKVLFSLVRDRVKSLHSYQVPEIIALPVLAGDPAYAQWVSGAVKCPAFRAGFPGKRPLKRRQTKTSKAQKG